MTKYRLITTLTCFFKLGTCPRVHSVTACFSAIISNAYAENDPVGNLLQETRYSETLQQWPRTCGLELSQKVVLILFFGFKFYRPNVCKLTWISSNKAYIPFSQHEFEFSDIIFCILFCILCWTERKSSSALFELPVMSEALQKLDNNLISAFVKSCFPSLHFSCLLFTSLSLVGRCEWLSKCRLNIITAFLCYICTVHHPSLW